MNKNFSEELKKELVKQQKYKKLRIFFGRWKKGLMLYKKFKQHLYKSTL